MRHTRTLLLVGLLLLLGVGIAAAQQTVPNQGTYFHQPANMAFDGNVWIKGGLYLSAVESDVIAFLPAATSCTSDTPTTLIPTRIAAGDWALGRTFAGTETHNITCFLNPMSRSTSGTGVKIINATLVWKSSAATALTAATLNGVKKVTYTAGTGTLVENYGTIAVATLSLATSASVQKSIVPITGQQYLNYVNQAVLVDYSITAPVGAIYYLYGVEVTFNRGY